MMWKSWSSKEQPRSSPTFDEKLAALFSAGNSSHQARFNKLIGPEVMAENHIAKTCGRPVTWQYQG